MIGMNPRDLPEGWISKVIIRHLTKDDLPALEWDGEFSHFRRVYADAYYRSLQGLSVLWVADLPSVGLIGQVFIQLSCQRPELADGEQRAYLYSFRIKPAYQSAGLGTRMLSLLEKDLIARGFKSLTLNVAKDNFRAQALYERLDYRVIGHEPGVWSYFDHQGRWQTMVEPAWRMEKILTRESIPAQEK